MKVLTWITFILLVIGGLNLGFVGFFNYDVIGAIFGSMSGATRTIFALIGLSAIYMAVVGSMMMSESKSMMSGSMSGKMSGRAA